MSRATTAFYVGDAGVLGHNTNACAIDDLIRAAQRRYPNKAGKIENQPVIPKYLGGDPKGPTVPLDAAYHQMITNRFRELYEYGQRVPSPSQLNRIVRKVYRGFPIPGM